MLKKLLVAEFGVRNLIYCKMKTLNIKRAIVATVMVWVLGVSVFSLSFFIPTDFNPELLANRVLVLALIPFTLLGARFYYKKGAHTHGVVLGVTMFLVTIVLDASLTVPLLILPFGGSYQSFFLDPQFWLIGLGYVSLVSIYGFLHHKKFSALS
jgi:hypothetical protein